MADQMLDDLRRFVRRRGMQGMLFPLCIYTLIALVVFYPVPFRLNSVLAGFNGRDGWEHAWWLWSAKRLMQEGRGLNDLYLLNHPVGLQHPYQWSLASFSLIAGLVGLILPPAATFNTMALGSFVLGGLAAYHLCRELTGNHWAAVVGGVIFAFCPNRLGHALAGWLPQMTVCLYPWYALVLIRALHRPTAWRGIGLGLLAAAAALVWPMHIAYFMLPLTLTTVGAELLRLRSDFFRIQRVWCLGLAFLVSLVIALPFFVPLLSGRLRENLTYLSTHGIVQHSTELLAFFTPSPYHPILAPLRLVPTFAQRVFDEVQTLRWDSAYLGLLPVLLAGWGLLRTKPRPWRWFAVAVGAALFSLGPVLVIAGEPLEYTVDGYDGRILLPYTIVRQIPFLDWGRTPGRLNATGMLGLGVLASLGMSDLLSRVRGEWEARFLVLVVVAVTIFEYLPLWPFPAGDATVPPVIQYIADHPGDGALLHVPMDRRSVNNRALYFQTVTGKPIVGGTVLRTLPEVPPWQETIEGLVRDNLENDIIPRPTMAERRLWLHHLDVEWVVLDRLFPEDEGRYRPLMEDLLGSAVVEDGTLTAFSVSVDTPYLERPYLYTLSERGWQAPEQDGGAWRRWMSNDGELYVYSAREEVGSLRFTVDSHLDFPLLDVYRDEQLLDTFVVGERATYTTQSFTLSEGMTVFRFHAPGGCPDVLDDARCWEEALLEPPDGDGTPPCDARTTCRTLVFDSVSFVPEADLDVGEGVRVSFADQMWLRGWTLDEETVRAGGTLTVTLTWDTAVELDSRYVVFAHLLSSGGELVAQHDDAPVGSVIPRSAWPSGATFRYAVPIELPDDLSAGYYRLLVGVYLWPDIERLPVLSEVRGADVRAVEVGRIEVVP